MNCAGRKAERSLRAHEATAIGFCETDQPAIVACRRSLRRSRAEIVEVNVALHPRGKRERRLHAIAASGRKLVDEFAKCEQDVDALNLFVRRPLSRLPSLTGRSGRLW